MRKLKQTDFKKVAKKIIKFILQSVFAFTFVASLIIFAFKSHALIVGAEMSYAERLDQNIIAICCCWVSITSIIALNFLDKKENKALDKNEKM